MWSIISSKKWTPCHPPRGPPAGVGDVSAQSSFVYLCVPLFPLNAYRGHVQAYDGHCADTGKNLDLAISVHHCHPGWLWILSKKEKKALICFIVRMGLFLACWGSQLWNLCLQISPLFNNAGCGDQNSDSTVTSHPSLFLLLGGDGIKRRNSCSLADTLVTTRNKQSLEPSKLRFINTQTWILDGFAWERKN